MQTIIQIPPKPNYYILAHLQCSLKFACKFIPWYWHSVDKFTIKKYAISINTLARVHQNPPYEITDMAIHQKCSASCKNTLCKILLNLDKLYRVHISPENMENVAIA